MPYLPRRARLALDAFLDPLIESIDDEGEANYVVSRILTEAPAFTPLSYSRGNAALGVLHAVGLEFYRRRLADYEDAKCEINGDLPAYDTRPPADDTPGTDRAVQEDER